MVRFVFLLNDIFALVRITSGLLIFTVRYYIQQGLQLTVLHRLFCQPILMKLHVSLQILVLKTNKFGLFVKIFKMSVEYAAAKRSLWNNFLILRSILTKLSIPKYPLKRQNIMLYAYVFLNVVQILFNMTEKNSILQFSHFWFDF